MSNPEFDWKPYADGVCITGITGDPCAITVPEELDGLPVRSLGEEAFAYRSVETVQLPSSLRVIEKKAFAFCFSLAELSLPDGLEMLKESCFLCTRIMQLTLPDSLHCIEKPETLDLYLKTGPDHPVYFADGPGLYQKEADGLRLLSLHTEAETDYAVCERTITIADTAFFNTKTACRLRLPTSLRTLASGALQPLFARGRKTQFAQSSLAVHPDNPVFFTDERGLWECAPAGTILRRWWGQAEVQLPADASAIGAYALAELALTTLHLPDGCRVEAGALRGATVEILDWHGPLLFPDGPVENTNLLNTVFSGAQKEPDAWQPDLTAYDALLLFGYLSCHRVRMSLLRIAHKKTPEEIRQKLNERLLENGGRVAEFTVKEQDARTFLAWLSLPGQTGQTLEETRAALSAYRGPEQAFARQLLAEVMKTRGKLAEEDEFSL